MGRIIAAIRDQPVGWPNPVHQRVCHSYVIGIACGKQKHARTAQGIRRAMELRCPAPARPAYALGEGPPFAPAAERCALIWVASIDTIPCAPWMPECPVSASNIPCQMPCRDQRLKRL